MTNLNLIIDHDFFLFKNLRKRLLTAPTEMSNNAILKLNSENVQYAMMYINDIILIAWRRNAFVMCLIIFPSCTTVKTTDQ